MLKSTIVTETELQLPLFIKGKVRDTYNLNNYLLIVATDRISAFDVILPNGIPDKGAVLNQISAFWFKQTSDIIANHMVETVTNIKQLDVYLQPPKRFDYPPYLAGRSMIVKKAKRLPIECVVRGYIAGSAWSEYLNSGATCGINLPKGLQESQELVEPLFTPTTKADSGHDMPLTPDGVVELVGENMATQIKEVSIAIYKFAREYARQRGIIIADTKMEFGLDDRENLVLIDELLTPDSSRFWDTKTYQVGKSQDSYDKQPVRDWLSQTGWNKEPPAPELPSEVIESTSARYKQAFYRLTGQNLK
ncbi:MAG: phosphoribosylaminoimidazolesuccinocarboxamide synthase [Dehalococcoidales bacterium]|nr:phosphoribosylaminoimidazolesuccinocarboxamide synthase [Dehalococcoidales bacterium]